MSSSYTIISFPEKHKLQQNDITLFESISATLQSFFAFEIDENYGLKFTLMQKAVVSHETINEAMATLNNPNNIHWIIKINSKNNIIQAVNHVSFINVDNLQYKKISLDNLYFYHGKYQNEKRVNEKRLFDSITYGILREIVQNNPANIQQYEAGLIIANYLIKNQPAETYNITKKTTPHGQRASLFFFKDKDLPMNNEKINKAVINLVTPKPALPQINIDDFDTQAIKFALAEYGTFEIVGPSIDNLVKTSKKAFNTQKAILNLPQVTLEKVTQQRDFHGFQNVRQETMNKGGPVRSQIAYHFKPYKAPRIPEGIDGINAYDDFYHEGMAILQTLYMKIAISLKIHPDNLSNYQNDNQSVLTTRKYFKDEQGNTGIPKHSDYGLLTLVVSDQPGLEVVHNEEMIAAPSHPFPRFFINVGDWLLFQLRNDNDNTAYKVGEHQVPSLEKDRYSMALFFNPPFDQKLQSPNGKVPTFQEYLFSDKSPFIK